MDERMFLYDIDDDQVMVAALEAHFVVLGAELKQMRFATAEVLRWPPDTKNNEMARRSIELRAKTMSHQVQYVLDECAKRKRRLRDRRNGLADVEVDEEPLELDPGPE